MTPVEVSAELERIRAAKNPTKRGIMICAQTLADMLKVGWRHDQLDSLEILFWACRDRHGDPILLAASKP